MADTKEQRKEWLSYNMVERGSEQQYPTWKEGEPNLRTFLDAFNLSQPIIQCKYELVWSRWPRTIFFAKNISIPGISVNTLDISHAGFTIAIPTHVTYENTEVTMNIIADKEGFHYYDLRNMVIQTGHPLVAGDPRATVGNPYNISPDEDTLEIRLRNKPSDEAHHHWIIHNFHPTGIGDVELTTDGSSFVEFELKGTFTHISYDCGRNDTTPPADAEPPPEPEEQEDGPLSDIVPEELREAALDTLKQQEEEANKPEEEEGEGEEEGEPDEEKPEEPEEPEITWDTGKADPEKYPPTRWYDKDKTFPSEQSFSTPWYKNNNCDIDVKLTAAVSVKKPNNSLTGEISPEEQALADQCNQKLDDAGKELMEELKKIAEMPPDPDYDPEKVKDESNISKHTPKDGQEDTDEVGWFGKPKYDGDGASVNVEANCKFKSAAQKEAYEKAMAKYKETVNKTMDSYKDTKAKMESDKKKEDFENRF